MFYYLFDYTAWYNWYYAVPTEVIKFEEEQKIYKEVETQTEPNKVEITAVENPDVNIAELETRQEHPIPKKKNRHR